MQLGAQPTVIGFCAGARLAAVEAAILISYELPTTSYWFNDKRAGVEPIIALHTVSSAD